jgi:hypothetical protein
MSLKSETVGTRRRLIRMKIIERLLITPVLMTLALVACGADSGESPASKNADPAADPAITLLTLPTSDSDGHFEALIEGRLNVGPGGCVRVGKILLVAPAGSVASTGGVAIEGVGRFAFGHKISTGGGYIDHTDLTVPGTDACRKGDTEPRTTAVVSGRL